MKIIMQNCSVISMAFLSFHSMANVGGKDESVFPHLFIGAQGGLTSSSSDNNFGSFRTSIGMQLNESFSWDLGYKYISESSRGSINNLGVFEGNLRYDMYFSQRFSTYFKGGLGYWMVDENDGTSLENTSDYGFSPLLEVGFNYLLTPQVHLNLGYNYLYNVGSNRVYKDDYQSYMIGLTYHFKGHPFTRVSIEPEQVESNDLTPLPQTGEFNMTLENVYFDHDSSEVIKNRFLDEKLDLLADNLKLYPEVEVKVIGHTDATGSESYNRGLSQSRAESVAELITLRGIDKSRIKAVGMGESRPIATNSTATGRASNRRVEIKENDDD